MFEPAPEDGARRALGEVAGLTDHFEQLPVHLEGELRPVDLRGGRVGGVQALVGGPRHLPVQELEDLDLGVGAGQDDLGPFVVDHGAPVGQSMRLRPSPDVGQAPEQPRARADRHALVVELIRDQLPALVLGPHEVLDGNPHVLVEGRAGDVAGDRRQRGPMEPGAVHRHDEDRQAFVLGCLGVGAAANQTKSAYWMALVKIFWPLITYSSPSRTALVCSEARSVPAEGSV